jgi:hypothetical protein
MTFGQLKIGDHFEFARKTSVGNGIFNLIGIKKGTWEYRMGGLNRQIGSVKTKVTKTKKELN